MADGNPVAETGKWFAGSFALAGTVAGFIGVTGGDVDAEIRGLLLVLDALHEEGHRLVLQRLVLGRAGLRELALLALVGRLGEHHQVVEIAAGDLLAVHHGDGVVGDGLVAPAAPGGDGDPEGEDEQGKQARDVHHLSHL